jgi:hypothetical protein
MGRVFKLTAALLLLLASIVNGVFGPLAHGHILPPAGATEVAVTLEPAPGTEQHAGCAGHEDSQGPAGHGPAAPGKNALMCSGATACCAAMAVVELPMVINRERVEPIVVPRPVLAGLTPPVGERPPSRA